MSTLHDFSAKTIRGDAIELANFAGKVCLVVNVASQCGLTPQYDGLQRLYDEYQGRGLEILGFPCNQFGAQEPGTEAEATTRLARVGFDNVAELSKERIRRAIAHCIQWPSNSFVPDEIPSQCPNQTELLFDYF